MSIISGTGLGRIVPVRDPERELRSSGSGSVTTYTMSPDELEAHFGKTIKPSRGDKGVAQFTLSKEEYLKERMAGKSREEIAQAQNVSLAGLGYWLKKWGIKDSYQEELEIGAAMLPPLKLSETDIQLAERIDLLRRLDEAKEDAASWKQTAEMYRRELEELQFKATDPSKLVDTRFEEIGIQIGQLVGKKKNAAYGDSFAKTGQFLQLLYPDGIQPEQYGDALSIVRIFDKLMRLANRKDAFDESPYRDIAGYGILGAANDGEAVQG